MNEKYVCTQAPLNSTVDDFWLMVATTGTKLIVMLCGVGDAESVQYWPREGETLETKDGIQITTTESVVNSGFILSKMELVQSQSLASNKMPIRRTIRHLRFLNWIDWGVPSQKDLLHFLKEVQAAQDLNETDIPTIMHCSAGVGRTGTVILLTTLLRALPVELDPIKVLKNLRAQRAAAVSNAKQFKFVCEIYQSLLNTNHKQ